MSEQFEEMLHHPVLLVATKRLVTAGKEYNQGSINVRSYEVYPFRGWAYMCHYEATRLCSFAEAKVVDTAKIREHAADLVNYARFIYDEAVRAEISDRLVKNLRVEIEEPRKRSPKVAFVKKGVKSR